MQNTPTMKIIIPTYNAGEGFALVLDTLLAQEGVSREDILIIDSSSDDGTDERVRERSIQLVTIPKEEFSHGSTRRKAAGLAGDVDYLVFMTQDALPCNEKSISCLVKFFEQDERIAAVYGRQVPYTQTNAFGRHARLFNYPDVSSVRSFADREQYGLKTAFFSNSFGAFRKKVLDQAGGFADISFCEDVYMAAKLLLDGWKIGYCAEAEVFHSHSYSVKEEYARYRMIGSFYKEYSWIVDQFGSAENCGFAYVLDEVKYLVGQGKWFLLPEMAVRMAAKYLGFRLG